MCEGYAGDGGGGMRQKRSFCRSERRAGCGDVVDKVNVFSGDALGMRDAEGVAHIPKPLSSCELCLWPGMSRAI